MISQYFYGKVVLIVPGGFWSQNWLVKTNDISFSAAYFFIGTAFLHPSMRAFSGSLPEKSTVISHLDLILMGAAFFIPPLVYLIKIWANLQVDLAIVFGSMVFIFCLVEIRLTLLVRFLETQNQRLNRQQLLLHHQAYHGTHLLVQDLFFQNADGEGQEGMNVPFANARSGNVR